jgi:tetratricopeptide (TPR) repeat protein
MNRTVLLGSLLLVAGAAAAGWWWLRPAPVEPPMPADIQETEVRVAIEQARQLVLSEPGSAKAWGHLGMVLLAQLFDRDAVFCFTQASRLEPSDPRWLYGRSLIALKREPDNAVALLEQTLAVSDSWPPYRSATCCLLAEAYLERLNLDAAEKYFRLEQEYDPDSARAALGLGRIAMVRGDEEQAKKYLSVARESRYARKKATVQLAAIARGQGDQATADALESENKKLRGDEPWPDPLIEDVILLEVGWRARDRQVGRLIKKQRYAEAAAMYLEQIKQKPNVDAYVGAGFNLARPPASDYERGVQLLRKAVELYPDSAYAHYTLSWVLFARAEKQWQQQADNPQLSAWFREAVEHGRRATELKPDHSRAYLFWGLALRYLDEADAAIGPLRKGVACDPADFELQLALGEVLLDTGQIKEAQIYLDHARRLDPDHPRLMKALQRLDDKKKTR